MSDLKITKGEWSKTDMATDVVIASNGVTICSINWALQGYDDNSKLIAEAGTVYNECGETPRELLEQNAKLVGVLNEVIDEMPVPVGHRIIEIIKNYKDVH